ncbi:hypothetical protein CHS0354_042231 [Potamilus streckersoni]|uniref:Uncharacterized protein n=1 Tax=Potamilus streckersoni TaxID=2493646 RepID=A0AAE0STP0_9BIVA|nr:hypothetical protein CHS0354_042231 [Potamilus streckersoni]
MAKAMGSKNQIEKICTYFPTKLKSTTQGKLLFAFRRPGLQVIDLTNFKEVKVHDPTITATTDRKPRRQEENNNRDRSKKGASKFLRANRNVHEETRHLRNGEYRKNEIQPRNTQVKSKKRNSKDNSQDNETRNRNGLECVKQFRL